jgi:hypothetical protein
VPPKKKEEEKEVGVNAIKMFPRETSS